MAVLGCRGCETPASPLHGVDRNVSGRTDAGSQSQRAGQDDKTAGGGVRGKRRVVPASGLPGRCWGESPQKSCPRDLHDRSARLSVRGLLSPPRGLHPRSRSLQPQGGCVPAGAAFLCRRCPVTVCVCVSPILSCLSGPDSLCVFPSFCRFVCACPCAWLRRSDECARCAQRRLLARRPGSAAPLSSASVPGSCGGLVSGFGRRSTWGP